MLHTQSGEQYDLIFVNHRGVADANLQASQETSLKSLDEISETERAAMVIKALQEEPYLTPEQKAKMIDMVKESPATAVTKDQEATEEVLP
jgi:ribosomal protein S1